MTRDGIFYYTVQRGGVVDVYSYEMTSATSGVRSLVQTNVSLSRPAGSETVVAGAADPNTGYYYFGYYSKQSWQPLQLHVFRYDGSSTRKIAIVEVPSNHVTSNFNGDFAFDGDGNLLFVVSSNGGSWEKGNALIGTVDGHALTAAAAQQSPPTIPVTSTIDGLKNADYGNGYNGIAFIGDGRLIVEQGTSPSIQSITNPFTFETLGNTRRFNLGTAVDHASCMTPPSLTIKKNVIDRFELTDQFKLEAFYGDSSTPFATATTEGQEPGVQTQQIGPAAVLAGATYRISETPTNNPENYTSTYQCTASGGQELILEGEGTSFDLKFPETLYTDGKSITCEFTNSPLSAEVDVSKSATPESGTDVAPGDEITYTLTFDNDEGAVGAEVDHVDHLADVLDDAYLTDGPTVTGNGLTAVLDGDQIKVTGEVPAGETSTVSYTVTVKPNTEDSTDREASDGGYILANFVTEAGEEPPATCEEDDPCTTHDVSAWTMKKEAFDAQGDPLAPNDAIKNGETITYHVTASKIGPGAVEGVSLKDDLTEVLKAGSFTGPAQVTFQPGSHAAVSVAGPLWDATDETWTLTTPVFAIPADATDAILTYTVTIGEPKQTDAPLLQMGTEFMNSAQGDSTTTPPNQCVIGDDPNDPACETTHTMGDGFFHIAKVDPAGTALSDHEFRIVTDDDGDPTDVDADATWEKEGDQWFVRGLAPGTYWVIETKTADGHELLASPVKIVITSVDGKITLPEADPNFVGGVTVEEDGYLLVIPNPKALPLPYTGVLNPRDLTIAGSLILAAALLGVAWRRNRIA